MEQDKKIHLRSILIHVRELHEIIIKKNEQILILEAKIKELENGNEE